MQPTSALGHYSRYEEERRGVVLSPLPLLCTKPTCLDVRLESAMRSKLDIGAKRRAMASWSASG